MAIETLTLTNKSTRVFDTTEGRFHPGTSKDFEIKEAVQLLGYSGEIVKAIDAGGVDNRKAIDKEILAGVEKKDKEIGDLKGFISKLTAEVKALKTQLAAKPRGPHSK